MLKPSAIVKAVYVEYIEKFGEPTQLIRFDNPPQPGGIKYPPFVDIMIWPPEEELNITTFATVGMSDQAMPDVDYRAELHFSIEGLVQDEASEKITIFLANLSLYPFMNSTHFNWWHSLNNPGNIPRFPSAEGILFYPAFVENGWDLICTKYGHVKILNVVPITALEKKIIKEDGVDALLNYFYENEINLFKDRRDDLSKEIGA